VRPFIQGRRRCWRKSISSVGGKTGINRSRGKNMIALSGAEAGARRHPYPEHPAHARNSRRDWAEVIKSGWSATCLSSNGWKQNLDRLLAREPEALADAILRCCRNKAEVVAADEEEKTRRAAVPC